MDYLCEDGSQRATSAQKNIRYIILYVSSCYDLPSQHLEYVTENQYMFQTFATDYHCLGLKMLVIVPYAKGDPNLVSEMLVSLCIYRHIFTFLFCPFSSNE